MHRILTTARPRAVGIVALGAAAALVLASCSTEQETADAGGNAGLDCVSSESSQAAYEEAWSSAADAFGLDELTPSEIDICEIDTTPLAAEPKEGDSYRIAFAAQGPTNSWGLLSDEALKYRADELGVEILYAAANGDATAQVDNIQQLASQDPDAMVIVPMGEGIAGQVTAAADLGIPVVLCSGVLPDGSGQISTVTRQYDLLGSAYAEWIAQQIDGAGQVAILSGLAGVPTAEYQAAAARDTFAKYPDIEVVTEQYTEWSPTVAKTVAENLIASYPDLDAIWSDSGYGAMGVIQAYTEAGKPVPPITGDSFNEVLMATGSIPDLSFAFSTFPPEMSSTCLDVAMSILEGEPVLNYEFIDSPSFTIDKAAEYVREDCEGALPVPSSAAEELLVELDLCS